MNRTPLHIALGISAALALVGAAPAGAAPPDQWPCGGPDVDVRPLALLAPEPASDPCAGEEPSNLEQVQTTEPVSARRSCRAVASKRSKPAARKRALRRCQARRRAA